MASQIELLNEIDSTELYFNIKTFYPEKCKDNLGNVTSQLTVLNQNIRSINKNFDVFEVFLSRLNFFPDIIVLTECFLSDKTPNYNIPGYNCHYSKHFLNKNDGLVIFTRDNLLVNIIEPPFNESNCLVINVGTELTLIAIYRSPSFHKIELFCKSLENVIDNYCKADTCVITGDINIDIGPHSKDKRSDDYLDITNHHGFYPGHLLATHDTSCLDHVLLRTKKNCRTVVCQTDITDHDTVLFGIERNHDHQPVKVKPPIVNTTIDYVTLASDLEKKDWTSIYELTDADSAANYFVDVVSNAIKHHTKTVSVRNSMSIKKPWINDGMLKCIRKRDLLHAEARKKVNRGNLIMQAKYKAYRNFCNNLIQNLKNNYESNLIEKSSGNSKKMWSALKKVCNITKKDSKSLKLLTNKSNPADSLNDVNQYFTNVGGTLAEKTLQRLNKTEVDLANALSVTSSSGPPKDSFFFTPTDEIEVHKIIVSLKSGSAPGWDGITNSVLKHTYRALLSPITFICNLSLQSGIVPACMKRANVCPIYKDGDVLISANYRPISLLSSISKILEKIVNKRLLNYIHKENILSDRQFGFRNNRSTEDAVTSLVDHIVSELDNGKKCVGIFLDLAKAFDTVSRVILLKKLEIIGIRGVALDWFHSYLTDRQQRVILQNHTSKFKTIKFGVPQGSVLGPTLFLLYINNLCLLDIPQANVFAFADDTALVFSAKTWDAAYAAASYGISLVGDWLSHNLLTLNADKTKVVNFSISHRSAPSAVIPVYAHTCKVRQNCNCIPFQQVNSIKYLGVHIDKHLKWVNHVDAVKNRLRKLIFVFKRLRSVANESIIKVVYYALCQAIVSYGIVCWGVACKSLLIKAERAQRAILKVAYKKPVRYPTSKLYRETKVLTVRQLFILATTLRFHKIAPVNLVERSRPLRHEKWKVATTKTEFGKRRFGYMGPFLYTRVNQTLSLLKTTRHICKQKATAWLMLQDYKDSELLLPLNT